MQDFKAALRGLRGNLGLTGTAVVVLALGIGANTAIFTVTNAVLLRSLPYREPDRIVLMQAVDLTRGGLEGRISHPFFEIVDQRKQSLQAVAAATDEVFNLTGHGDPEQILSARTSWNFFALLGVQPVVGRTFLPEEDQHGGHSVVMLSHEFAVRLFGSAEQAVGRNLTLDSHEDTVVGVLPAGFTFPLLGARRDIWAPNVMDFSLVSPARIARGGLYFYGLARLASGASREQAAAELGVLYQQYRQAKPGNFDATMNLSILADNFEEQVVAGIRPALLILTAAVACVLLIACANVAALLLSSSLGRRREFAVRGALGAARGVLVRQLLTESVLLSVISGMLGIAIGNVGTRLLTVLNPAVLQGTELRMDAKVLLFTLGLSLVCGMLFGLAPALELTGGDIQSALREAGRGNSGSRRQRARSVLVVGQVALSMMLLVASGLLLRSFVRLRNQPPGFDPRNALTMQLALPTAKYSKPAQIIRFQQELLPKIEMLPGVEAATLSTALPVEGNHSTPVLFEGQPQVPLGQRPIVLIQQFTPDYGKVMRIPLLSGRTFNAHDDASAPRVVLVNEGAAHRFWPNENAIGKKVWIGTLPDPFEVAGVLADTRNAGLASPASAEVMVPLPQMTAANLRLTLRTAGDPRSLTSAVRSQIASVDPDQPITEIQTLEEFLTAQSSEPRFLLVLLSMFAGAAFLLAAIGIYGVIAYSAAQRNAELGIRLALGATDQEIVRLILSSGISLTLIGIVIGVVASLTLTRLMVSLLYDTSPRDATTMIVSAVLFLAVSFLASYLPARRASKMDLASVLR